MLLLRPHTFPLEQMMVASTPSARPAAGIEACVAAIASRGITLPPGADAADPGAGAEWGGGAGLARHPVWTALNRLGTELWLDTGDMDEAQRLWSGEFTALTTNNTLLSKEVGKGIYDNLIRSAVRELREVQADVGDEALVGEIGILLNAHHGLRLVEKFGCRVSVELHTDLANDLEGSLQVARRLFAISPSHFIVKVPLTPSGILAARRLVKEGVPINFTLEFSARHNYVVARLANPDYVNVFLGRLNSFVAEHDLGDGKMVGEKATLASQRALRELRAKGGQTRQIAASLREPGQVVALAGVDVYTMPTAVAEGMLGLDLDAATICSQVNEDPSISLTGDIDPAVLEGLWTVPSMLKASVEALSRENLDTFTGGDLAEFLRVRGHADLFPTWGEGDLANIEADGKIPSYPRWRDRFEAGEIGLDAAFNAAGMASFAIDQGVLDERVRSLL